MPADAYALSDLPFGNALAQFIDHPRYFVSWNAWILNSGQPSVLCQHVAVAYSARLYLNSYLSAGGLRDLALNDFE